MKEESEIEHDEDLLLKKITRNDKERRIEFRKESVFQFFRERNISNISTEVNKIIKDSNQRDQLKKFCKETKTEQSTLNKFIEQSIHDKLSDFQDDQLNKIDISIIESEIIDIAQFYRDEKFEKKSADFISSLTQQIKKNIGKILKKIQDKFSTLYHVEENDKYSNAGVEKLVEIKMRELKQFCIFGHFKVDDFEDYLLNDMKNQRQQILKLERNKKVFQNQQIEFNKKEIEDSLKYSDISFSNKSAYQQFKKGTWIDKNKNYIKGQDFRAKRKERCQWQQNEFLGKHMEEPAPEEKDPGSERAKNLIALKISQRLDALMLTNPNPPEKQSQTKFVVQNNSYQMYNPKKTIQNQNPRSGSECSESVILPSISDADEINNPFQKYNNDQSLVNQSILHLNKRQTTKKLPKVKELLNRSNVLSQASTQPTVKFGDGLKNSSEQDPKSQITFNMNKQSVNHIASHINIDEDNSHSLISLPYLKLN